MFVFIHMYPCAEQLCAVINFYLHVLSASGFLINQLPLTKSELVGNVAQTVSQSIFLSCS